MSKPVTDDTESMSVISHDTACMSDDEDSSEVTWACNINKNSYWCVTNWTKAVRKCFGEIILLYETCFKRSHEQILLLRCLINGETLLKFHFTKKTYPSSWIRITFITNSAISTKSLRRHHFCPKIYTVKIWNFAIVWNRFLDFYT